MQDNACSVGLHVCKTVQFESTKKNRKEPVEEQNTISNRRPEMLLVVQKEADKKHGASGNGRPKCNVNVPIGAVSKSVKHGNREIKDNLERDKALKKKMLEKTSLEIQTSKK
jgi:hypothetical protein